MPHGLFENYLTHPITLLVPVIACLGIVLGAIEAKRGHIAKAFIENAVGVAFIIITPATALFPFLMPSSKDPASSLTLWDAT